MINEYSCLWTSAEVFDYLFGCWTIGSIVDGIVRVAMNQIQVAYMCTRPYHQARAGRRGEMRHGLPKSKAPAPAPAWAMDVQVRSKQIVYVAWHGTVSC